MGKVTRVTALNTNRGSRGGRKQNASTTAVQSCWQHGGDQNSPLPPGVAALLGTWPHCHVSNILCAALNYLKDYVYRLVLSEALILQKSICKQLSGYTHDYLWDQKL